MLSNTGLRAARCTIRPQVVRTFYQSAVRRSGHGIEDIKLVGAADNAFNRERLAVKQHAAATADFWRRLSIYVVIPALIITSAHVWVAWNEHWEHQSHLPPPSERPQYSYMNIRTKSFPWGDGDKTLFWNDKYNYHAKGDGGN